MVEWHLVSHTKGLHVTYKRITRRELLDPKVTACRPVCRGDTLLGRLRFLFSVDVRMHTLQAVSQSVSCALTQKNECSLHLLPEKLSDIYREIA